MNTQYSTSRKEYEVVSTSILRSSPRKKLKISRNLRYPFKWRDFFRISHQLEVQNSVQHRSQRQFLFGKSSTDRYSNRKWAAHRSRRSLTALVWLGGTKSVTASLTAPISYFKIDQRSIFKYEMNNISLTALMSFLKFYQLSIFQKGIGRYTSRYSIAHGTHLIGRYTIRYSFENRPMIDIQIIYWVINRKWTPHRSWRSWEIQKAVQHHSLRSLPIGKSTNGWFSNWEWGATKSGTASLTAPISC